MLKFKPASHPLLKSIKLFFSSTPPLKCHVDATCAFSRALSLSLPHGKVQTPVYMPVGTKAAMKGITQQQMEDLGCNILLANTYHLAYRPTTEYLRRVGGLHRFCGWNRNILTDSGGFQMVSFGQLSKVDEKGVHFKSPYGAQDIFLRPEDSIVSQNQIGSDIIMALDDVVKPTESDQYRMKEATTRTSRWIKRCFEAHQRPQTQVLFPIVQGGINRQLRQQSLADMVGLNAYGYAIGGLSGGENKSQFFKIVKQCCDSLPPQKPRYLMGVGYPIDLLLCVSLGVDMFDCVFATRTARFGTAFTSNGEIKLKNTYYELDFRPIEEGCKCETCLRYSRAYLSMIRNQDNFGHLISIHNIYFLLNTMRKLRSAIIQGTLAQFIVNFIDKLYGQRDIPYWVKTALQLSCLPIKFDDQRFR